MFSPVSFSSAAVRTKGGCADAGLHKSSWLTDTSAGGSASLRVSFPSLFLFQFSIFVALFGSEHSGIRKRELPPRVAAEGAGGISP